MPAGPVGRHGDGELPKRSTGTDCKSVGFGLRRFESYTRHLCRPAWCSADEKRTREGSAADWRRGESGEACGGQARKFWRDKANDRGCSSMVELLPSKQVTRVR